MVFGASHNRAALRLSLIAAAVLAVLPARSAAAAGEPAVSPFRPLLYFQAPGAFKANAEVVHWLGPRIPIPFSVDTLGTVDQDPPREGLDWLEPAGQLGPEPPRAAFRYPGKWASDTQCLVELLQEGVAFELLPPTPGIGTPVRLTDDHLGGVLYRDYFKRKRPLPVDCRLALSLARAGAVLRRLGVTEVIWSSTHRPVLPDPEVVPEDGYNMHNQGLAIDIRGFRFGTRTVTVAEHYERGLGFQRDDTCVGKPLTKRGLLLRMLVCDLDGSDLFSAILTPDYDTGHWNHLHIAVFHPNNHWRRRHKRTVLLEVPLNAIPGWAMSRPRRSEPELRRWEEVAQRSWPAEYEWLHKELQEGVARYTARRQPAPTQLDGQEDWLHKGFRWMVPRPHRTLLGKALSSLADTLEQVY